MNFVNSLLSYNSSGFKPMSMLQFMLKDAIYQKTIIDQSLDSCMSRTSGKNDGVCQIYIVWMITFFINFDSQIFL